MSTAPNGHDGAAQNRFELIPFDKIAFDTTPAYLVKGLIPRVGLCVVWGSPKCGKSFLVFDLLMHIALGWQYHGRRFAKAPSFIAHLKDARRSRTVSRRSA
jgi:AAA domain-containing protein